MPQELRVVCCYQCRVFQSDIIKKAKKWTCKMCGSKQSLVKEYARGSGKECRLIVQQLSERAYEEAKLEQLVVGQVLAGNIELPDAPTPARQESERMICHADNRKTVVNGASKWEQFRVKEEDEDENLFKSSDEALLNVAMECIVQKESFDLNRGNNDPPSKESVGNSWNPKRSLHTLQSKQSSQTPIARKAVPLMSFHQMDKKEKKQFKWESASMAKRSAATEPITQTIKCSNSQTNTLADSSNSKKIAFEPKTSKLVSGQAESLEDTFSTKRKPGCDNDLPFDKTPFMSFQKKSKWNNFARPVAEDSIDTPTEEEVPQRESGNYQKTQEDNKTTVSASKWSKFVVHEDEDDEGFS